MLKLKTFNRMKESILKTKLDKLKNIKDFGMGAYPEKTKRTTTNEEALDGFEKLSDKEIILAGRVKSFRPMGGSTFAHIEDGTGKIQLFLNKKNIPEEKYKLFVKNVEIGDFVEVKNSTIGEGTSVAHLTYIGDSDVGRHCNFGCGVVTVNYDGEQKNRTAVGDYAFIGCNTNLIAPVSVGEGAYTAAGTTVTKNVPAGALAVGRAKQENKEGWAARKLQKYIEKHSK
jgi:acetyltransferase-like isoleucine patch superfamily enzyme